MIKKAVLGTSTLVLTAAVLISCQREMEDKDLSAAPAPVREVETAIAVPVEYSQTVFATGRLSSKEEAKLSFKTGGIIRKIHVREGQTVRRGQLLAELDLDEIRAQAEQARLGEEQSGITIENAQLALQLAERDYQNVLGLYRDSVATLVQLENAKAALDNARNQVEAARTGRGVSRQQTTVANYNLRYSKISAPSEGVILRKLAEPNELVGAGTPVFLFGSREEAQVIKVNITDKDIINVQLEDEAEVAFDAYPEKKFRGVVREMASMADPLTGTYEVEVEVLPEEKKLLNGFIGSVEIHTEKKSRLLEIPVDALRAADEHSGSVFVLRDSLVRFTPVHIGRIRGEKLLIENGLVPGDEVVVSGVGYLEDKQPVRKVAGTTQQ